MAGECHPYGFPFAPYKIQQDFMDNLSQLLDQGGLGVFESPTGTVCGSVNDGRYLMMLMMMSCITTTAYST
jgi:Rad3-related DNA helicase